MNRDNWAKPDKIETGVIEEGGAEYAIGSMSDFGGQSLVIGLMQSNLNGREVTVGMTTGNEFRFDIKIEGLQEYLRLDIEPLIYAAIHKLSKRLETEI
ncbi:MAG: hypothetical protein AAF429_14530 [Pseudomonadota bacterium]